MQIARLDLKNNAAIPAQPPCVQQGERPLPRLPAGPMSAPLANGPALFSGRGVIPHRRYSPRAVADVFSKRGDVQQIRCNSGADGIVRMKENGTASLHHMETSMGETTSSHVVLIHV